MVRVEPEPTGRFLDVAAILDAANAAGLTNVILMPRSLQGVQDEKPHPAAGELIDSVLALQAKSGTSSVDLMKCLAVLGWRYDKDAFADIFKRHAMHKTWERLESQQEWTSEEMRAVMHGIHASHPAPLVWLELAEQMREWTAQHVVAGAPATEESLWGLTFGPSLPNGLRVAASAPSAGATLHPGDSFAVGFVFHNSGPSPVEFASETWRQWDTWRLTAPDGTATAAGWGGGIPGASSFRRIRLAPGEMVKIGRPAVEIQMAAGQEYPSRWEIEINKVWGGVTDLPPVTLTTGTVPVRVAFADPAASAPAFASTPGIYEVAPDIRLSVNRSDSSAGTVENSAAIQWMRFNPDRTNSEPEQSHPLTLPGGRGSYRIVWPAGGGVLWIAEQERVRKVDFTDRHKVSEQQWPLNAGGDFGGTPPGYLKLITLAATADKGAMKKVRDDYESGQPVEGSDISIRWGEPNEASLRLGMSGIAPNEEIPVGHVLPVTLFIRNDGREAVKLSPTGWFNEGLSASLTDENGVKHDLVRNLTAQAFLDPVRLDPGHFAKLHSQPFQTILPKRDGSPSTANTPYSAAFVVRPGKYTLELENRIGRENDKAGTPQEGDPRMYSGPGEWIGTLTIKPLSVRIAEPKIAVAKPGSTAEFARIHRLQFQPGEIVLTHPLPGKTGTGTYSVGSHGGWPTPGGTWKVADPAGDYLAAWDEGGTRLWYADATGVQYLEMERGAGFFRAQHWTADETKGDLADMPDGVRQALKLPTATSADADTAWEQFLKVTSDITKLETELDISVPAADPANAKGDRRPDELVINVKEDGSVVWNGKSLTLEELTAQLAEIAKSDKKRAIIIRGNEATPYAEIVGVLSATRKAGLHHVSFATTTATVGDRRAAAKKLLEEGVTLGTDGLAGEARVKLEALRKLLGKPGDPEFHDEDLLLLADAGMLAGRLDQQEGKILNTETPDARQAAAKLREAALNHFTGAAKLLLDYDTKDKKSVPCRSRLGSAYFEMGTILAFDTSRDASVAYGEAVRIYTELLNEEPENAEHAVGLAKTYDAAAILIRSLKRGDDGLREALGCQQHSIALLRRIVEKMPKDFVVVMQLSASLKLNHDLHRTLGDDAAADAALNEGSRLADSLSDAERIRGAQDRIRRGFSGSLPAPDAQRGGAGPPPVPPGQISQPTPASDSFSSGGIVDLTAQPDGAPFESQFLSNADQEAKVKAATAVAQAFLKAANVEEKLKFLLLTEGSPKLLTAFYQRHPAGAIADAKLIQSEAVPGGRVTLLFASPSLGRDVWLLAIEKEGRVLLAWEECSIYQEEFFKDIQADMPKTPVRILAKVGPDDFYNGDFSDAKRYQCYRLSWYGVDTSFFGYADRTSAAFAARENLARLKGKQATLEIKYPVDVKFKNQVEILEVPDAAVGEGLDGKESESGPAPATQPKSQGDKRRSFFWPKSLPDVNDVEKQPAPPALNVPQEDGSRTESVRQDDTLRESTHNRKGDLICVRVFTLDSKGRVRQGVIYDGEKNPLGSIHFGYDRKTEQRVEERQFNKKGQMIRRLFYPGAIKDRPEFADKFVAFTYDPENPRAKPVMDSADVKPTMPVAETQNVSEIGKPPAVLPAGVVEILRPGDYRAGDRIHATVTATEDGNLIRNELTVWATDDSGKEIADRCALPFGEGTWALQIAESPDKDGSCRFSLASRWGVNRFWFVSEKLRARFSKPGFDSEAFWSVSSADLLAGKLPQFADDAVVNWARQLMPAMKDEDPALEKPEFEVRLKSEGSEIPELVRPTWSHFGRPRIGRFVSMGPRLLTGGDVVAAGSIAASLEQTIFEVTPAAEPAFAELRTKYHGRKAVVLWKGQVTDTFELRPGLDRFNSSIVPLWFSRELKPTDSAPKGSGDTPKPKTSAAPANVSVWPKTIGFRRSQIEEKEGEIRESTYGQDDQLLSVCVAYPDELGRHRLTVICDGKMNPEETIFYDYKGTARELKAERHFDRNGRLIREVSEAELKQQNGRGRFIGEVMPFSYGASSPRGKTDAEAPKAENAAEAQRLTALGKGFFDVQQFDKAQATFESALTLDPVNAEVRRMWFLSEAMLARQVNPFAVPTHPGVLAEARKTSLSLTVRDADGRKVVPEFRVIAGVRSQAGDGKDVVNWQPHTLRIGTNGGMLWPLDKAYEEMALRVEADGCVPQVFQWIEKTKGPQDLFFQLSEDKGTHAQILTPEGQPAAGATVALAMVQRDAVIEGGKLRHEGESLPEKAADRWRLPRLIQVDAGGGVMLPAESDPTAAVLVVHLSGVLEMSLTEFKKSQVVKLQPWGRIEGKVQWGDKAGAGEKVSLTIHRDTYGYPGIIAQYEKTTAAADGSFVFEKVLPGHVQLSCPIAAAGNTEINLTGRIAHVDVRAGTNEAVIGGAGRTVKGKLTGRDSWEGVSFHFHPTAPHVGLSGDDEMWKAWSEFQKSPSGPLFFRNGLKVQADGTFEIPGALPGDYQIFFISPPPNGLAPGIPFELPADKKVPQARVLRDFASGKFSVPVEVPGQKLEVLDAGKFPAGK